MTVGQSSLTSLQGLGACYHSSGMKVFSSHLCLTLLWWRNRGSGPHYTLQRAEVQVSPLIFAGLNGVGPQLFLWYLAGVKQLLPANFLSCLDPLVGREGCLGSEPVDILWFLASSGSKYGIYMTKRKFRVTHLHIAPQVLRPPQSI